MAYKEEARKDSGLQNDYTIYRVLSRVKVNVSNKDSLFTKPHSKQLLRAAHSSKLSNFSYIKTTVNKTKKDSK